MKKMLLCSLLAVSAGQLFGAGFEAPVNKATGETKIEGLLQAIADQDLAQVKAELQALRAKTGSEQAFRRALNTQDSMFSPLGMAHNWLKQDKNNQTAKAIANELEKHGASLVYDRYDEMGQGGWRPDLYQGNISKPKYSGWWR